MRPQEWPDRLSYNLELTFALCCGEVCWGSPQQLAGPSLV